MLSFQRGRREVNELIRKSTHLVYTLLRNMPLRTFCLCGLFGILPDVDHVIQALWAPGAATGRILHLPMFIMSGTLMFCILTYLTGLHIKLVLERRRFNR